MGLIGVSQIRRDVGDREAAHEHVGCAFGALDLRDQPPGYARRARDVPLDGAFSDVHIAVRQCRSRDRIVNEESVTDEPLDERVEVVERRKLEGRAVEHERAPIR